MLSTQQYTWEDEAEGPKFPDSKRILTDGSGICGMEVLIYLFLMFSLIGRCLESASVQFTQHALILSQFTILGVNHLGEPANLYWLRCWKMDG